MSVCCRIAQQGVWGAGLVVQHHMWIVLAVLVLRWVMVSGTVLVLVFSVDKADRKDAIRELAPVLERLSVLVMESPRAKRSVQPRDVA